MNMTMESNSLDPQASFGEAETAADYRTISAGAVVGLALGGLSVLMLLAAASSLEASIILSPLPLAGVLVSLVAMRKIGRSPMEYAGKGMAIAGLLISSFFLFGGLGYASYVYATEVPKDHKRLSFDQMKPDEKEMRHSEFIPADIRQLDGKKIFIKGYIRDNGVRLNMDQFLLVRDNKTCCFGDINKVKYYDQIYVNLTKPKRSITR